MRVSRGINSSYRRIARSSRGRVKNKVVFNGGVGSAKDLADIPDDVLLNMLKGLPLKDIVKMTEVVFDKTEGGQFTKIRNALKSFIDPILKGTLTENGRLSTEDRDNIHRLKAEYDCIQFAKGKIPDVRSLIIERYKSSKAYALGAVALSKYNNTLQYFSDEVRDDMKVVLAYVTADRKALQYASDKLKGTREVVVAALNGQGSDIEACLKFASDDLKKDRDLVRLAVGRTRMNIKHAHVDLLGDITFVTEIMRDFGSGVFQYASDNLRSNKILAIQAVSGDGTMLMYASDTLKNNQDVVLPAVKQNGAALDHASDAMKDIEEIVMAAQKQHPLAINSASRRIKKLEKYREMLLAANNISNFFPF
jgi:hypothetical protein